MQSMLAVLCVVLAWSGGVHAEPRRGDEVTAKGWITDGTHPTRPGDFRKMDVTIRLVIDARFGEATIEIKTGEGAAERSGLYGYRRGRIFQVDPSEKEATPSAFGDLSPQTIAAVHQVLVATAVRERPENLAKVPGDGEEMHFAWNDELWTLTVDDAHRRTRLSRRTHHDVYGDGAEAIEYSRATATGPLEVVITARGRETARLEWSDVREGELRMPAGDPSKDRVRTIALDEMVVRELAPRLFAMEMPSANSRVFIAEFKQDLVVFEGAYTSRNVANLAERIEARFHKPVRYFAFSHLHGQYVGGVREWVHRGATVLAPPGTEPLVREVVGAKFELRPDSLLRQPVELSFQAVAERWSHADDTGEMVIYNTKKSDHTDEYFIVHFPRTGVVLTGDLLFYRPGKPFSGRSAKLCGTLKELGIEVRMAYPTWPLEMAGVKNVITGEEFAEASRAAAANNEAKPAEKSK